MVFDSVRGFEAAFGLVGGLCGAGGSGDVGDAGDAGGCALHAPSTNATAAPTQRMAQT